jgi:hypothetical protein
MGRGRRKMRCRGPCVLNWEVSSPQPFSIVPLEGASPILFQQRILSHNRAGSSSPAGPGTSRFRRRARSARVFAHGGAVPTIGFGLRVHSRPFAVNPPSLLFCDSCAFSRLVIRSFVPLCGLGVRNPYALLSESAYASTNSGSTHFPCSRIKSTRRSTASASGMLNLMACLPT